MKRNTLPALGLAILVLASAACGQETPAPALDTPLASPTVESTSTPPSPPTPETPEARKFDPCITGYLHFLQRTPTGEPLVEMLALSLIRVEWEKGMDVKAVAGMGPMTDMPGEGRDVAVIRLSAERFTCDGEVFGAAVAVQEGHVPLGDAVLEAQLVATDVVALANPLAHIYYGDVAQSYAPGSPERERASQRAAIVQLKVMAELQALFNHDPIDYTYPPAWELFGHELPEPPWRPTELIQGADPVDPTVGVELLTFPPTVIDQL